MVEGPGRRLLGKLRTLVDSGRAAQPLADEIERVRADEDFAKRARTMLERNKELLDRLAR